MPRAMSGTKNENLNQRRLGTSRMNSFYPIMPTIAHAAWAWGSRDVNEATR